MVGVKISKNLMVTGSIIVQSIVWLPGVRIFGLTGFFCLFTEFNSRFLNFSDTNIKCVILYYKQRKNGKREKIEKKKKEKKKQKKKKKREKNKKNVVLRFNR